ETKMKKGIMTLASIPHPRKGVHCRRSLGKSVAEHTSLSSSSRTEMRSKSIIIGDMTVTLSEALRIFAIVRSQRSEETGSYAYSTQGSHAVKSSRGSRERL
ncbi:hypothetical protein BGZ58_006409, partial [Dissophora ornata]